MKRALFRSQSTLLKVKKDVLSEIHQPTNNKPVQTGRAGRLLQNQGIRALPAADFCVSPKDNLLKAVSYYLITVRFAESLKIMGM